MLWGFIKGNKTCPWKTIVFGQVLIELYRNEGWGEKHIPMKYDMALGRSYDDEGNLS